MKKCLFFAAVAAVISIASCSKQEAPVASTSPVFTATINQTRTNVDLETGEVSWEIGDTLSIYDGINSAIYEVTDVEAGGRAILTLKPGQTPLRPEGPDVTYTATYGFAPLYQQEYGTPVKDLPMIAKSSTLHLNFSVTGTVLRVHLTCESQSIKKVAVRGVVDGLPATDTTFVLICPDAVDISSGEYFDITLPTGNYDRFIFTNATGCFATKTAKLGHSIAMPAAAIQPINFSDLLFSTITDLFSIAPDKQIRFTKSNLYWNGKEFKFEKTQLDCPTSWNPEHVGHFFWTSSASNACEKTYTGADNDSTTVFCEEAYKENMVVEGIKCYALSHDNWNYLIGAKLSTGEHRENYENLRRGGVTVDGVKYCLIIAPDNYNKPLKDKYTLQEINEEGLVCLAPTSTRANKTGEISTATATTGAYLTTTTEAKSESLKYYYSLTFTSNVYPTYSLICPFSTARAIRLVTDPEVENPPISQSATQQYSLTEIDDIWF